MGMTASPWNGWGSYPIVTAFQVPLDGVPREEMQEWLDFLAELTYAGTSHDTYFDLGTQVIVSAIVGGGAWNPLALHRPSPSAPPLPSPSPCSPPPSPPPPWSRPSSKEPRDEPAAAAAAAASSPPPDAQPPAPPAAPLRTKHRRVKKVATAFSTPGGLVVGGLAAALVLTALFGLRRRIARAIDVVSTPRRTRWGLLQFPTSEKLTEMPVTFGCDDAPGEEDEGGAEPEDALSLEGYTPERRGRARGLEDDLD